MLLRSGVLVALALAILAVSTLDALAQRRGSFGGFRSSRSYTVPRAPSSFGGTRQYTVPRSTAPRSFGSSRLNGTSSVMPPPRVSSSGFRAIGTPLPSADYYRRSYGIPRRQEVRTITTPEGPRTVIVHTYGGYGDNLLMGYLLGQTSWLWMLPFHPAFYYTQPYYVPRPDGTIEYYPPTFSLAKLIFVFVVIGAIAFIVWVIIRNRKLARGMLAGQLGRSSFGG